MENQDYYAFLESILTDPTFTLEEKIEAEAELQELHACWSALEESLQAELSAEQIACAYADWLAFTGSENVTELI
jgi:hypothetical protein